MALGKWLLVEMQINDCIESFMSLVASNDIEIYNEFSLQHELGIHLRHSINNLKIQFERNVTYFGFNKDGFEKREIDISLFEQSHLNPKIAIELKFPRNGQHPEQMFSFCKDIVFLEQLKLAGFEQCYFIVVAEDQLFYQGNAKGIYSYFRGGEPLHGTVNKPTGYKDKTLFINGNYKINWLPIRDNLKYACVKIL